MKKRAVLACFLLVGCDKPVDLAIHGIEAPKSRYSLVAIGDVEKIGGNGIQAFAWKIDSYTGATELCRYIYTDLIKSVNSERLTCDH